MFLHTITDNIRNGVMCVNYLRSGETISQYFNHVLKALRQLHNDYIRSLNTAIPYEFRSREIYWPWFKDCVGTIDGTHILALVLSDIVARFHVIFDLTFSYVLAGWEGSAHDVLVLNNALQRQNRLIVPNGNPLCMS
ncbi:hypothetical protein Taro_045888 [Colocasia esculenta]|uniref:DUF8040 domain-containing protein n=1 Tax=Colocasia esculenta TaxID=4460 RepID=A0A843WXP1_COLES|nr:hypothetical protein [Colocasia esculenta]